VKGGRTSERGKGLSKGWTVSLSQPKTGKEGGRYITFSSRDEELQTEGKGEAVRVGPAE